MEWNNRRLHNTTGIATGAAHNLELIVKEFQSIFTLSATILSSRGETSKVEYTYGWYSASVGNK
jgi:hypothetical protein